MKVFLGGTCNNSLWREDLIPKLTIDYFNPVVDEWNEEAYHTEVAAKLDCNYFLYCLTPKYTGYFSFAEVVNESFHYSNQTIFCFLSEFEGQKFTETEIASLNELGGKVVENGGLWLDNLKEVAEFLNSTHENRVQLNKYDFFISYGRKHSRSLASNLNNSFIEEGMPVWMDTFCIPTGVDFRKSIKDGITRSDNFIYIISPHSVQSEYCTKELELAIKYGKRIIPVLHIMEPGMEELMHPEIQKLNWVLIDAERKYKHGFSELLALTNADQEHVGNNTKWLQKAIEWDSSGRHKDFLLSATETILAEHWYDNAVEKEKSPPPSELNGVFIKKSAKAILLSKKRRKGMAFLIAGLGFIMTIAFIVAINYYVEANNRLTRLNQAEDEMKLLDSKIEILQDELAVAEDVRVNSETELSAATASYKREIAAMKLEAQKYEKQIADIIKGLNVKDAQIKKTNRAMEEALRLKKFNESGH
ncbi:MAG: TIR domain-containing protein [Crocinitomix sp.]|nr:TIR domain-containing protein [Crocinitomix sp.]